jgi:erythromycin esterase
VISITQPRFRRQSVVLLTAIACSMQVTAQQSIQSFAKWASSRALPLETVEPRRDVSDLRPLRPLMDSARVVAIGEPGHGYHEPLSFRNRLFTFLVAEMGFTAIAIESGLSESRRIQEFVAGGPGNAAQVTRDNLTYRFGRFQENVALVQWIRDYNSDPSNRWKVRFYGIDISLGGPRTATPTPVALETALSYVTTIDAEAAARFRERLQPFLDRLRVTNPESFSEADRDLMTGAIGDLIALLERQRQTFVARTSNTEYEWALRNAISARQADRVFRLMPPPNTGSIPPGVCRQMTARDEALAENVRWILEQEGRPGKSSFSPTTRTSRTHPLRWVSGPTLSGHRRRWANTFARP